MVSIGPRRSIFFATGSNDLNPCTRFAHHFRQPDTQNSILPDPSAMPYVVPTRTRSVARHVSSRDSVDLGLVARRSARLGLQALFRRHLPRVLRWNPGCRTSRDRFSGGPASHPKDSTVLNGSPVPSQARALTWPTEPPRALSACGGPPHLRGDAVAKAKEIVPEGKVTVPEHSRDLERRTDHLSPTAQIGHPGFLPGG